jgi:hypothetical protein
MNSLMRCLVGTSAALLCGCSTMNTSPKAQFAGIAQLPAVSALPDPLMMSNGRKVATAQVWNNERRPELKAMFAHYMYGEIPPKPSRRNFDTRIVDKQFLNGAATLKLVTISIPGHDTPKIDLLVVTPNAATRPAPAFLVMNFCGNHAVHPDPRIPLAKSFFGSGCKGCVDGRATDAARGTQATNWPLEQIIARGYAFATFANADVDSDRAGVSDGVYAWVAKETTGSAANAATTNRGCIAGWAWGFQRCLDYLVTDLAIDPARIAAVGHSRNGKTALLAAAYDERFALAIPHQAGCGGTAPNRVAPALAAPQANGRPTAETMAVINKNFPHWFNAEYKKFNDAPEKLPFDQHELVALMAPRPVLLSNAAGDKWANPSQQFEVLKAAEPVYRLLNAGGCDASEMPPEGKLVSSKLGYYIRPGAHSMTSGDWMVFLDFADQHLRPR